MVVFKFGGKSLASKEKVLNICNYIKQVCATQKVVVVVSAMGNKTDDLITMANEYGIGKPNLRELDVLLSTGETESASILAIALNCIGVKAISLQGWQTEICTMGVYGQSVITGINKNKIIQKLESYDVVVITGFQGINRNGDVTTLGRGGSDTTAVALGAVLNCEVEIYSDYDGIFAGDPKLLNFKKFDSIDYNSMQQMANNGAKVLSSASVDLANQAKVKLVCKQSNNPQLSGTFVCNIPKPFIALSCIEDLCEINIIYNGNESLVQKTAKYIVNNVKYYKIFIKNNKITLLIHKQQKQEVILKIAKINKLLEVNNV